MTGQAHPRLHAWLVRQGHWRRTDLLRVAGAVSVPLAWARDGAPSGLALLLVLGGQMLLRFVDAGPRADAAGQVCFLAAGWWAAEQTYRTVPQLDLVAHAACGLVLAVLTERVLCAAGWLPTTLPRAARAAHLVAWVVLLGVLWELGEAAGHTWLSPEIGVGWADTLGDLVADGLGGAAGAALAVRPGAVALRDLAESPAGG